MHRDDLPDPVAGACAALLDVVPGDLLVGLYLRGGVGFGEWVPGQSDVDFVMTLTRRPSGPDVAALRGAHAELARLLPDLHVDGMHVLGDDLARDPALLPPVPVVLMHTFTAEAVSDPVVAWHELAWHGVTVVGPDHESLGTWTSADRLRAFTTDNLDTYWRRTAESLTALPPEAGAAETCTWCVLGVTRLHHLLETGEMTTKSAAGRWALATYPGRFGPVLREALALRGDPRDRDGVDAVPTAAPVVLPGSAPWAHRGRQVGELVSWVVEQGTGRSVARPGRHGRGQEQR